MYIYKETDLINIIDNISTGNAIIFHDGQQYFSDLSIDGDSCLLFKPFIGPLWEHTLTLSPTLVQALYDGVKLMNNF